MAACDPRASGDGRRIIPRPRSVPWIPRWLSNSGESRFGPNPACLYTAYLRGEAYLADQKGTAAATQFQKILDHDGVVWNCWTGALAHFGLARAQVLEAQEAEGQDVDDYRLKALMAYKDFLRLWKDADPDVPVLTQAKDELANMQ